MPIAATKYVRGIELRADNPRILHHASVGVDSQRVSRKLDGADGQPGFAAMPDDAVENVYGWSPGKAPFMEPADRAWTLAKGSDLVVQMHLLPSGKPEVVRPSIGLFLSDTPPAHEPLPIRLESKTIDIPAGQADYAIEDSYVLLLAFVRGITAASFARVLDQRLGAHFAQTVLTRCGINLDNPFLQRRV